MVTGVNCGEPAFKIFSHGFGPTTLKERLNGFSSDWTHSTFKASQHSYHSQHANRNFWRRSRQGFFFGLRKSDQFEQTWSGGSPRPRTVPRYHRAREE